MVETAGKVGYEAPLIASVPDIPARDNCMRKKEDSGYDQRKPEGKELKTDGLVNCLV